MNGLLGTSSKHTPRGLLDMPQQPNMRMVDTSDLMRRLQGAPYDGPTGVPVQGHPHYTIPQRYADAGARLMQLGAQYPSDTAGWMKVVPEQYAQGALRLLGLLQSGKK